MKKGFLFIYIALCLCFPLQAQERSGESIPDDVFYLMPQFGEGMVYFRGQTPAQGRLNICAVDNSLRYIGKDGEELSSSSTDNVLMVQIDSVKFIHDQDGFYRMYPVGDRQGIALQRKVRILVGAKQGAYGTVDQTSSIRQTSTIYSDGAVYSISKNYPYEVSEDICLYMGYFVFSLTKKNLKKMFPSRKEEIDAYFKSGHSMPKNVPDAVAMLSLWVD
jgi:hypothetical protein